MNKSRIRLEHPETTQKCKNTYCSHVFTCSHFDSVSCFISLARFPFGNCPSLNFLPLLFCHYFLMSCPTLMRGTCVCPMIFTLLVYFCLVCWTCISECHSNCHCLNFDLLDVWFLDSGLLVDYWFCLLIWNWLQVADLLALKAAFILTLRITN